MVKLAMIPLMPHRLAPKPQAAPRTPTPQTASQRAADYGTHFSYIVQLLSNIRHT
jgi:hypothetical protein